MIAVIALLVVLLAMLAEMIVSRRHERQLRAAGAVEPPEDVYRAMQWVYPGAFVAMSAEGLFVGPPPEGAVVTGIALLVAAKALKYWAIGTLGVRWSFRVLVPPGAPLIRRGPYRFLSHPNYVAIIGELAAFALIVRAPVAAIGALGWFGVLILRRIRVEERALGRQDL